MKKLVLALFTIMFFLAACGNQADNESSDEKTAGQEQTRQSENQDQGKDTDDSFESQSDEPVDTASKDEEADKEDDIDKDKDTEEDAENKLADFAEYEVLTDEIDVDKFKSDVKADNSNKRVILFANDNGKKEYKSIYIKKKDRLKIIHLGEDGQIFNEVID